MKPLDEICIETVTDKASVHPTGGHDYARHYDKLFSHLRDKPIKLLEIGVGGGQSVKAWLEYFPNASVYGVDNVRDTNEWNTPRRTGRYTSVYGDQSDPTFWKCFIVDYGQDWDIIIDDGGHCNNEIILTFDAMWPVLKSGGLYAIEDLGVSYGSGSIFVKPGFPNHMVWIKGFLDHINGGNGVESIYCSKELAVIKKL